MKILITLAAVLSTTIGQNVLIYLVFPGIFLAHGVAILVGLLVLNSLLAGLILFFEQQR
jgi:hypothetical protein